MLRRILTKIFPSFNMWISNFAPFTNFQKSSKAKWSNASKFSFQNGYFHSSNSLNFHLKHSNQFSQVVHESKFKFKIALTLGESWTSRVTMSCNSWIHSMNSQYEFLPYLGLTFKSFSLMWTTTESSASGIVIISS